MTFALPLMDVRRPALPGWAVPLLALLLGIWIGLGSQPVHGQGAGAGKVTGRIVGLRAGESVKGAKVVLVRFTLDEKGQPQGAPIQMKDADSDGGYAFDNVPIDSRSVYQLGTRIDGSLIPSETFTFPDGKQTITLNLRVPERAKGAVTDNTSVRIIQALIALEPQVGGVWVTDVVHLENPTKTVIESARTPLELTVPPDAESLEVMRQEQQPTSHQRVGNKLLIAGNLPPGITTIAYRYRLPVLLGTLRLEKTYPRSVAEMVVLAPAGMLKVTSERLDPKPVQAIEGHNYDVWGGTDLTADGKVRIQAVGVPLRQTLLLAPFGLFLVIMAGVVVWYLRKRLPATAPAA